MHNLNDLNYLLQILFFWQKHEEHLFSVTEVALYFYLLEVCNKCHWKNPFKRNNAKVQSDLSISFKVLKNARKRLEEAKIISFQTANGKPNVTYRLTEAEIDPAKLPKFNEVTDEVRDEVRDEINKTKQNKTKQRIPPNPPDGGKRAKKNEGEFDFSFVGAELREAFEAWLAYKKTRRERYKTQRSLELCYENLEKFSGGDPAAALAVVEQSMANSWAGMFPLKNAQNRQKNGHETEHGGGGSRDHITQSLMAEAERIDADFRAAQGAGAGQVR
jgi:DNA-binding HxlR family transcriptional regulator